MLMYRANGVQRRLKLELTQRCPAATARKLARKTFAEVAEGRDPSAEKRARRESGEGGFIQGGGGRVYRALRQAAQAGKEPGGGRAADRRQALAPVGRPKDKKRDF